MRDRSTEFLINGSGQGPTSLRDAIQKVRDASHDFRYSWLSGDIHGASESSQVAFVELDYIQNELLRQRDARNRSGVLAESSFESALQASVGKMCAPIASEKLTWFQSLEDGAGALPSGAIATSLPLGFALNKLKHRASSVLKFSLPADGGHLLYFLTLAGMGQPDALCEIDVVQFCLSCASAADCV